MDITKLTHHHLLFLPHPDKEGFYAIDDIDSFEPVDYFDYLAMHNKGIRFQPAFAYLFEGSGINDFKDFLISHIASGHEHINDSFMLLRDYYEFKTFGGHEQWIEQYQQHKETQRRFWLMQMEKEDKRKPEAEQPTLFD